MSRRGAANEVRHVVTDYGPDPYAVASYRALVGEAWARTIGYGGHVYTGDQGDLASGQAFGGVLPSPQQFVTTAPLAANGVLYTDASATIDTAPSEGPTTDPVARILAQRLRNQAGG